MSGADEIDGVAWKLDLPACDAASLRDLRIAVKLRDPNCEVDAQYLDKLQALVDALAKRGAKIKEAEPTLDTARFREIYILLLRAATSVRTPDEDIERWRSAAAALDAGKEPYLDLMVRGNTLRHRDWLKLNNERHGLRRAFAAFFKDWDILLCPVGVSAAVPHDHAGERWQRVISVNGKPVPSTTNLFWAGYSSLVYLPSTVGPVGFTGSGCQSRALPVYTALRRIGSGISGGSESSDYFLTNGFASICGGHGRSWWVFAKVQAIGKMVWMAGTAPGINGIEIEIARRFVSLWKSSRDKFRQRFAECIERQPHSARSREFEAHRHESLGII
jgi:Amidase